MSIDVTTVFETYREAARHVRNTYFSTRESMDWDLIDDFDAVSSVLLDRIVLNRILPDRRVVPVEQIQQNRFILEPSGVGMKVMISRDAPSQGYWDHPLTILFPGEAVLAFRSYFDWDSHGLIDFRYYRATVIQSAKYPDIIGHEALIDTIHANITYQE